MLKKLLIINALSIVLGIAALILAIKGLDGWGWFLFCSVLSHLSPSYSED